MLWLLVLAYISVSNAATHEDYRLLHQTLMTNYTKVLRPTFNSSIPTTVDIGFYLLSLKEFEEKSSKFSVVGAFSMTWHDFQLVWNPDNYGGIEYTFFPQSSLWKPDILLVNPYEKLQSPGFDDLKILVRKDGIVNWSPPDIYDVTCPSDVTYYPFDQQICSLHFAVYMHTTYEVFLEPRSPYINLDYYSPNSLWDVKNANLIVDPVFTTQTLILETVLQRRPMFQVINTIVPFSILGLLNIMVFLLPAESGERVGFSVTVLLAVAVFMTIVADTLPGTSEPSFPRLCYLLTAELCVNTFVTICTILVSRLHHKPKHHTIPSWLQNMICKGGCFKTKTDLSSIDKKHTEQDLNNGDIVCLGDSSTKTRKAEKTDTGYEKDYEWNSDSIVNGNSVTQKCFKSNTSWHTVANFLDIFFFVTFLVISACNKIVAYFVFTSNK
ncbi:neuronal acetylcholine receptor subunit alpha-6-like [Ylistrum balloti]|uniref:neuronal acetylcholine receptor subunit alpha-6-like n=1 Tax=Ylistrum balloti TaxID=509963 RepID=UPI002905AEE8|nr:neuronal acetylcholine receptor subunit alpha-6-like [Ylistrum balloti]